MVITPKYLFSKESEGNPSIFMGIPPFQETWKHLHWFLQQQSAVWRSSSWITKISEKWQLSDSGRRDWFDCRNSFSLVKCHAFEGVLAYSSYCGFFEPSHFIPSSGPLVPFFCAHLALSRPQHRRLKEWVRRKGSAMRLEETEIRKNHDAPLYCVYIYIYIYCIYIYMCVRVDIQTEVEREREKERFFEDCWLLLNSFIPFSWKSLPWSQKGPHGSHKLSPVSLFQ